MPLFYPSRIQYNIDSEIVGTVESWFSLMTFEMDCYLPIDTGLKGIFDKLYFIYTDDYNRKI